MFGCTTLAVQFQLSFDCQISPCQCFKCLSCIFDVFQDVLFRNPLSVLLQVRRAIVDKFGRFPHRNRALHRKASAQELSWLWDFSTLPSFVKTEYRPVPSLKRCISVW